MHTAFCCQTCALTDPTYGPCPRCGSWDRTEVAWLAWHQRPETPPWETGFSQKNKDLRDAEKEETPLWREPSSSPPSSSTFRLSDGRGRHVKRLQTGIAEWDRVVGGGTVLGTVVLLAATPGSGKSTLALQILDAIAKKGHRSLLVSGEEMVQAVAERAERLGCDLTAIDVSEETDLSLLQAILRDLRPSLVVIDSLQKITAPSQPRLLTFVAQSLCKLARENQTSMILISHVNKEDDAAGEQAIKHEVDAICSLDLDPKSGIRYLSASKNRYGSTEEVGLFQMTAQGLLPLNTDSLFRATESCIGSVPSVVRVGRRYLLLSVEALLDTTHPDQKKPKLVATGIDLARLKVILGVLAQAVGERIEDRGDLYLQVGFGGPYDPSTDVPVAMSILSAFYRQSLPFSHVFGGEIRLTGQIHPPNDAEFRSHAVRGRLGGEAAYVTPNDIQTALHAFDGKKP